MTDTPSTADRLAKYTNIDADAERAATAETFDRDTDPLAAFEAGMRGRRPFAAFVAEVLLPDDPAPGTLEDYTRTFEQWEEFMAEHGRHPACPSEAMVRAFIRHRIDDVGNTGETARSKVRQLRRAYRYWQDDAAYPHPTDFDPFSLALEKERFGDAGEPLKPPRIPIPTLRAHVGRLTHIRDRAIVVTMLKLGLRSGELCNMELRDVNLTHSGLREHYPELGSHPALADYQAENAVYIPSRYERDGNKSKRARLMPLDDELERLLRRWLLIRPDDGEPWVFLSKGNHKKLDSDKDPTRLWKEAFHPEFDGSDGRSRPVTSHYGRHRFTTWWTVEMDTNRELVKYMRGDVLDEEATHREAIDAYVHTYYEDIRDVYLGRIFRLDGPAANPEVA